MVEVSGVLVVDGDLFFRKTSSSVLSLLCDLTLKPCSVTMMINVNGSPFARWTGLRSSWPQLPPGAEFKTNCRSPTRGLTCKTMSPRRLAKFTSNLVDSQVKGRTQSTRDSPITSGSTVDMNLSTVADRWWDLCFIRHALHNRCVEKSSIALKRLLTRCWLLACWKRRTTINEIQWSGTCLLLLYHLPDPWQLRWEWERISLVAKVEWSKEGFDWGIYSLFRDIEKREKPERERE